MYIEVCRPAFHLFAIRSMARNVVHLCQSIGMKDLKWLFDTGQFQFFVEIFPHNGWVERRAIGEVISAMRTTGVSTSSSLA